MTRLEQLTRERFGDDAQRLLDAHAIIPLVNPAQPKAAIKGWMDGFDPTREIGFHSLGLLVGERSGITVWDIDSIDLTPPADPNVKTFKGCHVYTSHSGERRKIGVVKGLDILGENSYAIFYGKDKEFVHPQLAPLDAMTEWLNSMDEKSSIYLPRAKEQGYVIGQKNRAKEQGYCEFLLSQGYELDAEAVRNQYVKTIANVSEGSRNTTLYRFAREMVRCGLETDGLATAAEASGLSHSQVIGTIHDAEAAVILSPGKSVYDRVTFWKDNAVPLVPSIAHPVMDEIACRAIEVNDLAPFFPQQDIADRMAKKGFVRDRSTVSKILTLLESEFGVIKIVRLGFQSDGKRNPNAYRLSLAGEPVSEVDA